MSDVLITPASSKIEFKDASNNIDGVIKLDTDGNLELTAPNGGISFGDTSSDVFIGNGTDNVDLKFEADGSITGTSGVTLTLGSSGSNISFGTNITSGLNVTGVSTFTSNIVANGNIVGDNSTNISGISSVTATSFFGNGSGLTGVSGGATGVSTSAGTFTANAGSPSNIDSFAYASNNYKVAEYTLHFTNGSNIQAQKLLVMQDGTNAFSNEYAIMFHSTQLVSVDAVISGSNVLVRATPESGISGTTTFRWRREVQE